MTWWGLGNIEQVAGTFMYVFKGNEDNDHPLGVLQQEGILELKAVRISASGYCNLNSSYFNYNMQLVLPLTLGRLQQKVICPEFPVLSV